MIKKVVIVLLLLLPTVLFAEEICDISSISVEPITVVNKTDGVSEKSSPTYENGVATFNIKMTNVGDYIEYRVKITNNSNHDIETDSVSFGDNNSSYFRYIMNPVDDGDFSSIKAHETREALLKFMYVNEVPSNIIPSSGIFNDNGEIVFNLVGEADELKPNDNNGNSSGSGSNNESDKSTTVDSNPPTGDNGMVLLLIVFLFLFGTMYLLKKDKNVIKTMAFLLILLSPIYVNSMCKYPFKLVANIEINRCNYKLITNMGSFSKTEDIKEICVNDLLVGRTIDIFEIMHSTISTPRSMYFGLYPNIKGWKNDSYIRVYNNREKEQLLLELKYSDAVNTVYNLGNISLSNKFKDKMVYYYLGEYDEPLLHSLYVESSSELFYNSGGLPIFGCNPVSCTGSNAKIPFEISIPNYNSVVRKYTFNSPYIKDQSIMDQVNNLKESLNDVFAVNGTYKLSKFTNCHIYESGMENVCDGNNYYAVIDYQSSTPITY